jgi:hypothetical protein
MMKKSLCLVMLFICGTALFAQELKWQMALSSGDKGLSFSSPVEMKSGDSIDILLSSENECFAYIIIQDTERNVVVLKSGKLKANDELRFGPMQLTPPGGPETFYIVMSRTEQKNLQQAVDTYNKNGNSRNSRNLISSVMRIRQSVSGVKESPEIPVSMGGSFRGTDTSPVAGTGYSGQEVYVKSIIVNH